MKPFPGFSAEETFTEIPDSLFSRLLQEIEDVDELKVTLHALWAFQHMEGPRRYMQEQDFTPLVPNPGEALRRAVDRGILILVEIPGEGRKQGKSTTLYFLNSPRGRVAAEAVAKEGKEASPHSPVSPSGRPNIFRLYEENIGPLTPLLADALVDAEKTFPPEWVAEALEIAVKRNKRNWSYVEAILKRWKVEGHAKKQDRRDTQEDGSRYIEGEYSDFIKH